MNDFLKWLAKVNGRLNEDVPGLGKPIDVVGDSLLKIYKVLVWLIEGREVEL